MRETDYRKANDSGRGGPVATGLGRGDEFVLVNATKTTADATASASASAECGTSATGEAYELGGSREKDLASYVGRRVEITGTLKAAKTTTGAAGEAKPTGGFDPLKQDLKLFEVDVASFRALPAGQSAAAQSSAPASAQSPSPAAPATPPASAQPAPRPSTPAAQPSPATPRTSQPSTSTAPRQNLPRTASPLPLTGLFGLLSFATGLVLRRRG